MPTTWLTYDPEDGYEEHATEEEGRAALAGLLDQHRDWAADHVHEAVERVALYRCELVASIKQDVIASRDDDTPDGAMCRERGWDFMVRLEIADD